MLNTNTIQEGLAVKSLTGKNVGTVDHMDGERYIKLAKSGSRDGKHHWIPTAWVERVEDDTVYLNKEENEVYSEQFDNSPMQGV
jgi:hypothetical protein